MKEKTPVSHEDMCFQMLDFETTNSKSERSRNQIREKYLFLENYVTSEGAVSQNVVYYQQLPIPRNQVGFYVNNYFE